MQCSLWRQGWLKRTHTLLAGRGPARRQAGCRPLFLELLEDRVLPATVSWVGGSGDWATASDSEQRPVMGPSPEFLCVLAADSTAVPRKTQWPILPPRGIIFQS